MIVDSSALIAIVAVEDDADVFIEALSGAAEAAIGAPTMLEAAVVAAGRGPFGTRRFDQLVSAANLQILAFTAEHAEVARLAYRDFGRGSGHRAGLNFGDCMAYAMATVAERPLLFKGDDFTHTDIRSALDAHQ